MHSYSKTLLFYYIFWVRGPNLLVRGSHAWGAGGYLEFVEDVKGPPTKRLPDTFPGTLAQNPSPARDRTWAKWSLWAAMGC